MYYSAVERGSQRQAFDPPQKIRRCPSDSLSGAAIKKCRRHPFQFVLTSPPSSALGQTTANQQPLDQFTPGHFMIGGAMKRLGFSPILTLLASLLWEVSEDYLKVRFPRAFPRATKDSKVNAVTDMAAWMAGYYWF